MTFAEFVDAIPGLAEEAKKEMLDLNTVEHYKKGEIIHPSGKLCNRLYFIESGLVRLYHITLDGKEITDLFGLETTFITTIDSFYQPKPSHYNLAALEDCVLHTATWDHLEYMAFKYVEVERMTRMVFMKVFGEYVERVNETHFKSAPERYQYLMDTNPSLFNRAPLGHIASYLGMTQETLSRLRARSKAS